MTGPVRFRSPVLVDERSDHCAIQLAENLDAADVDALIDGLLDQIGARVLDRSGEGNTCSWDLDYSGHSLRLVYARGTLRIEPLYASAGCAIHDLHELFALRASPSGY